MMFDFLKLGVLKKGVMTRPYPGEAFRPCDAFLGRPDVDLARCTRCGRCAEACPASCLVVLPEGLQLDLASCIFCAACARSCPECITMGREFELSAKRREDLRVVFRHG